uniref:Uncharacterized protein n=1 Tax=Candidatus Nitrotoga fabula TaxID=2182327 RepID=A0A2X0QZI7_9PROT|nr:protein of unknown function [Candidatus Nitrotoga fabula]
MTVKFRVRILILLASENTAIYQGYLEFSNLDKRPNEYCSHASFHFSV